MGVTLTTEAIQEIYEAAVHEEAVGNDPDTCFALYGILEDLGGSGATIRKLIDMVRAANREAQPVAVTDEMALAFHRALNDGGIGEADLEEIKVGLRGALCNITAPPAVPDERKAFEVWLASDYSTDGSGKTSEADEKAFQAVLWHVWQARAMPDKPVISGYKLPPHVFRELVNSLRDTTVKYHGTDQLRERLNTALNQFVVPDHPHTRNTPAQPGGASD